MSVYEYKVVPAPKKGQRGKGVRGGEHKFANALETLMNNLGADGWDYRRTDTLPCEERSGLTGRTTTFQNMLVFRREKIETAALPEIMPEKKTVAYLSKPTVAKAGNDVQAVISEETADKTQKPDITEDKKNPRVAAE